MLRVRETERHGQNIMHWKCNRNIVFMSSLLSNTPKLNVRCSRGREVLPQKKTHKIFIVYFYMYVRGAPLKIYIFLYNIESQEKLFLLLVPNSTHGNFHSFIEPFQHAKKKKHNFYEIMKTFLSYFS